MNLNPFWLFCCFVIFNWRLNIKTQFQLNINFFYNLSAGKIWLVQFMSYSNMRPLYNIVFTIQYCGIVNTISNVLIQWVVKIRQPSVIKSTTFFAEMVVCSAQTGAGVSVTYTRYDFRRKKGSYGPKSLSELS